MSAREGAGGLELRADGAGCRLRLRVSAGASRSRVVGLHGGALKLSVAAAPEKGKANREVVRLVAAAFGLGAREVEIVSGETSPDKVVRLSLPPGEAARRWGEARRAPDTIRRPTREAGTQT